MAHEPHIDARPSREGRSLRALAALSVAAIAAVLVPLVLISRFNHSYADDWHYGVWAHLALEQTGGNPLAALAAALQQVGTAWLEWQGTYSAIFFMALEPSVFGEQWYALAAPLVLATLVAGTLFFSHVLLVELMGADRSAWLAVSCAVLCVQLLLQPSPVEGIFWFNSAFYYTTYHAAVLAMLGLLARVCDPARAGHARGCSVAAALLAAFVAGGNFVDALVAVEVVAVMVAVLLARARPSVLGVVPSFGCLVVGLALSLAAPGNSVRQQTQFPEDHMGAWDTVWNSSLACFQWIQDWGSGLVLVLAALCVPLATRGAAAAVRRGMRFAHAPLVSAASVALFATSFTPTFWAEGSVGPGRVQNARFDLFVILVVLNVFWWCGSIAAARARQAKPWHAGVPGTRAAAAGGALALLVGVCIVGSMAADADLGERLSSVSAARSLASGQAQAYHEQVLRRLDTIEHSSDDSLTVPFYTDVPHVLLMGDIRDNMDNYINYRLAQWYGKTSIVGAHVPASAQAGTDAPDAPTTPGA